MGKTFPNILERVRAKISTLCAVVYVQWLHDALAVTKGSQDALEVIKWVAVRKGWNH